MRGRREKALALAVAPSGAPGAAAAQPKTKPAAMQRPPPPLPLPLSPAHQGAHLALARLCLKPPCWANGPPNTLRCRPRRAISSSARSAMPTCGGRGGG
jgi:hypothetical protein